jgi:hypothetical protein
MYHSTAEALKQAIDDAVCGRKAMEAYSGILQTIMELRSLCNHGTLTTWFGKWRNGPVRSRRGSGRTSTNR